MKYNIPKSIGYSKSGTKRKLDRNTGLLQETTNISNNLTLYLKEQEKEEEKNCLSQQKERNCKDQSRNK